MTRMFILGAGTPHPSASRFGSSFVVDTGDGRLMFDCGPATTHKLAKAGLLPTDISHLFFTHHHFDHDADLPCFLLSRWDQSINNDQPLSVFGPPPTERLTHGIIDEDGLFWHDIRARINAAGSQSLFAARGGALPRNPPVVNAHDIGPGLTINGPSWSVKTGKASHVEPWLDSIAYRLEVNGVSIVFLGDTVPCQSVVDLAQGCDVLVAPCWDLQCRMEAGRTICGNQQAAQLALDTKARSLLLVHSVARINDPQTEAAVLQEIGDIYKGECILANEGMVLAISKNRPVVSTLFQGFPVQYTPNIISSGGI